MSLIRSPSNQAAPDATQNERIVPSSPLAIIGLFVEIIRRRYSIEGMPWVWNESVHETQIVIESAFVENTEERNFRPAIFVDKDESTIGRVIVGDRAGVHLPSSMEGFYGLMTVPLLIDCISTRRGESATIGDTTQFYLHASSDLIQASFGLHDMTPVVLGRTTPFERDHDVWVTPVTFTVQVPVRWSSTPTAPLLQDIITEITHSDSDSATEYLEKIAISYWP